MAMADGEIAYMAESYFTAPDLQSPEYSAAWLRIKMQFF